MDQRKENEERNKRVGWLVSVSVQVFMLALFYFLIAWKAPNPPIPEYGIELGFAQSAGSAPPVQSKQQEEVLEEVVEDLIEPTEEAVEEPVENVLEETSISEPEQESVQETEPEVPVVEESEVPVETPEPQELVEEVVTEVEEVEESSDTVSEKVVKEEEVQAEEESQGVDEAEQPSESESEEEVEEPSIDERAIYGSQGSTSGNQDGASLSLSGWIWDFEPKPADDSDETGKIVYKIVVDQEGYLVKIETVTTTVSPSVERKYREAVAKLTFSKTSDYKPASLSSGTLTFIIKSR